MISLALQGEKFTSYFFCLIFAIFLSLKITVIFRNVCCLSWVVSIERTWNEAAGEETDHPAELGCRHSPHARLLLSAPLRDVFLQVLADLQSLPFVKPLSPFPETHGSGGGSGKKEPPPEQPPTIRKTVSAGVFWASVESGQEPVHKQ